MSTYEAWQIVEAVLDGKAASAVEMVPELALQPYRPGSGTEGMAFDDVWCERCARDAEFRKDWENADPAIGCQILAATLANAIDNPDYPKEWVYGRDGRPCCTAFTTDPNKPLRCDKTADLFAALKAREGEK